MGISAVKSKHGHTLWTILVVPAAKRLLHNNAEENAESLRASGQTISRSEVSETYPDLASRYFICLKVSAGAPRFGMAERTYREVSSLKKFRHSMGVFD